MAIYEILIGATRNFDKPEEAARLLHAAHIDLRRIPGASKEYAKLGDIIKKIRNRRLSKVRALEHILTLANELKHKNI